MRPIDHAQRMAALDPAHSCIVQAPAGSGKTTLLTLRYLALLARVDAPEEILAITFTRKAAAEMAARVMESLRLGQQSEPPASEHDQLTWRLAQDALTRNTELDWQLLENPNRLRVQTIDSFCASISRQMPVVAQFGAVMSIQEKPQPLYAQAARETLALIDDPDWSPTISQILQHLDNQLSRLEQLLAVMLARRDQWLRHLLLHASGRNAQRDDLEDALQSIRIKAIRQVCLHLADQRLSVIQSLAQFASAHLDADHPIAACADSWDGDAANEASLSYLLGLADLLLTKDGGWRKQVTKSTGFPPASSAPKSEREIYLYNKQAMTDLLAELQDKDELRDALHALRALPAPSYSTEQWQVIEALLTLLPVAVAQLKLVFQSEGCVDFCEMAHAADRALGEAQAPSDLALRLDYRIQHVLVDEFQDTSETQFELLSKLLAGWQHDDGRTLFLVGDPMQSIYRFRQAEVGLFLKARQSGVGPVGSLVSLRLQANFRSQSGVVDWVNQTFPAVFPEHDDIARGAIRYSTSDATQPALSGCAVGLHPIVSEAARKQEADEICAEVLAIRSQYPEDSIAILVSGRNALSDLIPRLKAKDIPFAAQEIDSLGSQPVIKDLLSLTRAMLHPADRVAWLSILRAPWCGLTLTDLYTLVAGQPETAVWDLMWNEGRFSSISERGRQQLLKLRQTLAQAFANQQRMALRDWVRGCWLMLAGPACVADVSALIDAEQFFDLLGELEQGADIVDFSQLQERVDTLYAAPQSGTDIRLQIMTIHKAKGLEFDHVLLPGLDRKTASDQHQLLNWMERPRDEANGEMSDLLLAPIPETGEESDATSLYLRRLNDEKSRFEIARLVYVAITRAKKRVHLWFQVKHKKDGNLASPMASSLLHALWPAIESQLSSLKPVDAENANQDEEDYVNNCLLKYLSSNYVPPSPPENVRWRTTEALAVNDEPEAIEYQWVGQTARYAGIVTHHILYRIGSRGMALWQDRTVNQQRQMIEQLLLEEGVEPNELHAAVLRVHEIICTCVKEKRGQWVLNPQHRDSACESRISGVISGQVVHAVLDRTFIDDQDTRWIIDYKTGTHEGSDIESFLDREVQRYRAQLQRYGRLMRLREDRPIQLALYYPALSAWRSWAFDG